MYGNQCPNPSNFGGNADRKVAPNESQSMSTNKGQLKLCYHFRMHSQACSLREFKKAIDCKIAWGFLRHVLF